MLPMMELENLDKRSNAKKKTFRFLSGILKRNSSDRKCGEERLYSSEDNADPEFDCCSSPEVLRDCLSTTPHKVIDVGAEMENLHLSRQDNPYLQSSCEALADSLADDTSLLSPGPGSPRPGTFSPGSAAGLSDPATDPADPATVADLHQHLVRSPPPVSWPNKMFEFPSTVWSPSSRSPSRPFSPESGSECQETDRSYQSYSHRSQSEERIISPSSCQEPDLLSPSVLSPSRGQTPTSAAAAATVSPGRGQTPDMTTSTTTDLSPPTGTGAPRYHQLNYSRSVSHGGQPRVRSRTPDEEFSPTRFNIYTLHQRGAVLSNKSESSYLMTSPGQVLYQPASRRSLAQLASGKSTSRKSSTEHFLSWIPRRARSRSRSDAKSMENLQSPTSTHVPGIRTLRDSSGLSHKSMSAVGGEAGHGEMTSPRPPRRRFSGIKKSLSLRQKKGPLYVDMDSQENI